MLFLAAIEYTNRYPVDSEIDASASAHFLSPPNTSFAEEQGLLERHPTQLEKWQPSRNGPATTRQNPKNNETMKDIYDYDVYDRSGEKVGTVENIWAGEDKEIEFIGIKTGWLGFGKNHLIPAQDFTIDEQTRTIRVPYDEDVIKSSPSFESTDELGDNVEQNVYSHFGLQGRGAYSSQAGYAASAGYGKDVDEYAETDEGAGYTARATNGGYHGREANGDYREGEEVEVPLAQESIQIEKREKQLGQVRLRKVIRSEVINQPVELRREDVVVERVTGSGSPQSGQEQFVEKVVTIPISEEEAVVQKTVESAGAVRARKVVETEQENVSETVRKEDVEVERDYEHAHHRD